MRTHHANPRAYLYDLTYISSFVKGRKSKRFPCGCSEPARHSNELFMTLDVRISATDSFRFASADRVFRS